MASFGKSSTKRLETLHSDLQRILKMAIQYYDFSITGGHRNKEDQNKAFKDDKSTKQWPDSKHNSLPSKAVDVCPYPVDWDDVEEFFFLAGIIFMCAKELDVIIRWGGRFNDIKDCPHFELVQ